MPLFRLRNVIAGWSAPAIAGALARELGEEPAELIVVAALEIERDSACKDQMVKRFGNWRKRCPPESNFMPDHAVSK